MGHCVVGSHKHIPAMVLGYMYPSLRFTWPPEAGLIFVKRVNLSVAAVSFHVEERALLCSFWPPSITRLLFLRQHL